MNIHISEEEKIRILNGDDLYGIMQRILLRAEKIDQDREHFWIVGLSTSNRILFIELIGLGSVNSIIAEPMDVFSLALQKRAVKIVLVHNHPSGQLRASDSDKANTDQLIQAGRIVNTEIYDHLIITTQSYMSFRETGLLDELKASKRFVPQYQLEQEMRKRAEELSERGAILAKSEIVLTMLSKGMSVADISEYTGISVEEIELLREED